jgi:hypothetical protein
VSGQARAPLRCLLLLPSIHFVLKAEQLCQRRGLDHDSGAGAAPDFLRLRHGSGLSVRRSGNDQGVDRPGRVCPPRLFRLGENNEFFPLVLKGFDWLREPIPGS